MRLRNILIVLAVLVVGVRAAGAIYISTIDFNQYRGLIAEQAKAATGRDLVIKGELKLALGFTPAVAVDDVTFANAPWGTRPEMATVKRFEAQVELLPLISGNIKVKRIVLVNADILLETDAQGRGNWVFDTGAKPTQPSAPQPTTSGAPGKLPVVSEVVVRDSKLVYRDGRTRQVSELDLQRVSLRANSDNDPLKIDVDGAFNGHSFQVVGQVGAIAALTRTGTPYPVSLVVRSPEAGTIKVDGQIKEPMTGKGYELAVAAEGNEIAKLAELGGVKVPLLGPFKAELKLTDGAPGGNPSVPSLKVELGKPELVLVRAQGAIRDPIGQKGIAITASVEGREIGAFSGLALPGMAAPVPPIPALGPFRANVRVTEGPAGRPAIPELKAELGRPDLIHATLEGAIQDPLQQRGINIAIAADSQDLAALGTKMGTEMPVTGPMTLQARVSDTGPERYALSGVKLNAGGSDVAGEATLSMAGGRPNFTADFASNVVDLTKVGGGKAAEGKPAPAPRAGPSQRWQGLQQRSAALRHAQHGGWRAQISRGQDSTTSVAMQNLNLTANLRGGEFTLRPLTADIGGGKLNSDVALAAKGQSVHIKTDTKGVSIGSLLQESKTTSLIDGAKTDFNIDVRGTGPSLRAVMASLNGTVVMVSGEGTVHTKYLDLFGGDVLKVINPLTQGADTSKLNCIANRFEIQNGVGTTKVLVADTQRTSIMGEGTFNLGSEQLQMTVTPKSKDASLLEPDHPDPRQRHLRQSALSARSRGRGEGGRRLGRRRLDARAGRHPRAVHERRHEGRCLCDRNRDRDRAKAPAAAQTPSRSTTQPGQQQQQPGNPVQDLGRNLRGLFGK